MTLKLAFTTLACPEWRIDQVIEAAQQDGYDAVELRLLDGEVIDPHRDRDKVLLAVARCRAAGIEVCALDTSCRLNQADPDERARELRDLVAWIDLAGECRVRVLRVFGGETSEPRAAQDENSWVAEILLAASPSAEQAGVTVALETHDAFASARRVAAVLSAVPSRAVGALWDSHHPYRMGERAADVAALLGDRIVHVHVKDARRIPGADGGWQLVPMGDGEVPVRAQLEAVVAAGYAGYVSVEWEKKWHPELADPSIALPAHAAWLRATLGSIQQEPPEDHSRGS